MSDDSSPSSPARIQDPLLSRFDDDAGDAGANADASASIGHDGASSERPGVQVDDGPSTSRRRRRKKKSNKKRHPALARKLEFVSHLLKTLDIVVFAELSALYYMECSIFHFILRSIPQYMYLTPKDKTWPFLMPATRVHVLLVAIPNIVCMFSHLFSSLPQGPDYHRGYQHGGMIIDFIGQKPPAWRTYYLLADLVILFLQCLMLTIHTERERLRVLLKTFRPLVEDIAQEMAVVRTLQDLDAEEQGLLRDADVALMDETSNLEMRPLRRRSTDRADGSQREEDAGASGRSNSERLLDVFSSGNAIIGDYNIIQSLSAAAFDAERTAAHSLQTISYEATMAALQARRRAAR